MPARQASGTRATNGPGPEYAYPERYGGDEQGIRVEVGQRRRPRLNSVERFARHWCPQKGQGLKENDDNADAGHKPRDNGIRRIGHEPSESEQAESNLEQPAQYDDCCDLGQIVGMLGDDDRRGNRCWPGGPGYLRRRSAQHRGQESDHDCAV